jgi:hypothetical protein
MNSIRSAIHIIFEYEASTNPVVVHTKEKHVYLNRYEPYHQPKQPKALLFDPIH